MTSPTNEQQRVDVLANRISAGAVGSTPTCPTCHHLNADKKHPGWGWCGHPSNRVYTAGWPQGFTPSQSPTGTCGLHPERIAALANVGAQA